MKEQIPTVGGEVIPPVIDPPPAYRIWLGRLVRANPFYLASVLLFLFGINRLSVDPTFFQAERANLVFNVVALEVYEMALIVLGLWLARRAIRYDSLLLAGLDQVLALVPFILLTHSVLVERQLAVSIAAIAGLLAAIRYGLGRAIVAGFPRSTAALTTGLLLLIVNMTLPFYFRHVIENGTEAWERPGRYLWLGGLPLLVGVVGLLPGWRKEKGQGTFLLALTFAGLWLTGTAVHFYCVGYIAEIPFRMGWIAPTVWVTAWILWWRRRELWPGPKGVFSDRLLSSLPLVAAALSALSGERMIWVVLMTLSGVIYAWVTVREASVETLGLAFLAAGAVVAGLPGMELRPGWRVTASDWSTAGMTVWVTLHAWRQFQLQRAVCAAVCGTVSLHLVFNVPLLGLPLHTMLAALVIYDLFWAMTDARPRKTRLLLAAAWAIHGWVWNATGGTPALWTTLAAGLSVFAFWFVLFGWATVPGGRVVLLAAGICLMSGPVHQIWERVRNSPTGLLAIGASFLLLGAGTLLALLKGRRVRNSG